MSKLIVSCFSISVDGYGAGPNQTLEKPMGEGVVALHDWMIQTQTFQDMHGNGTGNKGLDNDLTMKGFENIGAWIMGRNMFGPIRGEWPNEEWKGWWGPNPPYHTPVYVLTNHPRQSLEMEGDNIFHFVTDGIHSAYKQAMKAANGKDVRLGGGVSTIHQYLKEGLIDEMHIAVSPTLIGNGENFFSNINLVELGYAVKEKINSELATHFLFGKI